MFWFTKWMSFSLALHVASAVWTTPRARLNDGNYIPMMGLGTAPNTSPQGTPASAVRQSVNWAIENGYRHIDTAYAYDTSEAQVGLGVEDCIRRGLVTREDVFITTKLWSDSHTREKVLPALIMSLVNLRTDYVDLYLIHFPVAESPGGFPEETDYLETWQVMEDAQARGLAKSIGVANFNIHQLTRLLKYGRVRPAAVQIEVSPTLPNLELVQFCHDHNITVIAHSPFGFTIPRMRKIGETPSPHARDLNDPALVSMAKKYGKNPSQIALRYLVDRGVVPIPKAITKEHIISNHNIFDFHLTDKEVDYILENFNVHQRLYDHNWWRHFKNYPYNTY